MQPKFLLQHWLWRCTFSNWLVTELRALHNERRISLYQEEIDSDFEPSITRVWTRYDRCTSCGVVEIDCLINYGNLLDIIVHHIDLILRSTSHSFWSSFCYCKLARLANHHLRKEIVCDCFRSDPTSDHFKWRVIPLTVDSRTTGVPCGFIARVINAPSESRYLQ